MTLYEHRQPGRWLVPLLAGLAVLTAGLAVLVVPEGPVAVAIAAGGALLLGVAAWSFNGLAVRVTAEEVHVAFGPGVLRRRIPVSQIRGAEPVRNRWWYGWGVRYTPRGWLWNVGGLDAVELDLASGRRFRIGTDEPQALAGAIRRAIGERA
jgi:hypothetical protein